MADKLKASPTYPGQEFLGGLGQVAERLGISLQEAMGILAKEGNSPVKAFIGNLLLADPLKSAGTALQDYTGTPRDITPESPYSRLLSGAGQTTRLDPRALDVAMFAQPIASVGAKTAPKITKSLIDEALTPRSGRRAQEGAVKLGGGNWSSRGVDDAMRPLKKEYALTPAQVIAARHERLGGIGLADAKSAAGLNTYGEPLSRRELLGEMSTMRGYKGTHRERLEQLLLLPHELAVDTWVDKQMRKYLTDKLATPDDSIRIAADAWPAQQTKLLEAKQAQIDKAVAARDKLQIERNVAPEVLTRSNAHIRELETEKRLIKYRKGLHGGEFEEYANDNPFAELTPADMSDMNLAGRRTDAGMPAEGFGKTPMGKAWENATDEAIISTPAGKAAALRWFPDDTKWIKKLPRDTPIYNFNPNSTGTPLGFSHLVDEIRNAVSPDSTLPAQFRIDAKDLSKWTVPQMSEHVDKINAWRKVQSEDAINASREGIPVHKEYPEGYQWLAVPDLQTNPEALKYATEIGCQGGWCTQGADTAVRYGSGNNRLYVLHNPEGKAVAQISTKPNLIDPIAAKYAKLPWNIREEIRADAMAHNPHVDKRLWGTPLRPGSLKDAELAMRDTQLSAATLRRFPELAEQIKLKRIAEIKGLQNKMPEPEDLPYVQDFVRSQQWSDVNELHNAQMVPMDRAVKLSKWLQEQGIAHSRYMPEQEYSTHLENFNRAQTPENGMKRGGPVNQDAMQMAVWNKAIRKQGGGEPTQAEIDAATLPARMNPNFQRQAEKIKSQGKRDFPIMGPLELGSQVLSGTAAMIPATLYGVYKDITSRKAGDAYSGQAAGNQAVKDALEMLTYQPRTVPGQDLSETFAHILEASKLPPYFGHLGTPHVVPGTGRLLMENATAPRDPFFAGPLGRQRGAVKPLGNLNLQPNIAVETLKGPEVQTLESFINQSKSMPGVTKEGFGEGLGAAQSITPSSKMSKSDFEKYVAPSKYEKVKLADDSGDVNEHLMDEAFADAGTRINEQMGEVGVPTDLRDAFRDLYSVYVGNPDALSESPVSHLTANAPLRNWLDHRGYRTGNDILQEMDEARNTVADRLYSDFMADAGEREGTLPPFFDVQRLVDYDEYAPYTYEAVGVLHPSETATYRHFPYQPNMVGHFRGSLMHEVVEAEGGVKIPPNAFLVEEVQSDAQQNKAMSGHLHQIHATVAKAAIQHALEMGADSVYFPSSIPISEVRTGSEKNQKLFRRVYDTEVMKGAIDPLRKMKGVTVTGIGKVLGDVGDPKFLYHEVKFSPEAKEQILKGKGQLAPGYAKGGVVEGEPTQAEIDAAMLPARMNPNLAAQGDAYRANMAAPTSIMDPRYPAWKKNQNAADAVGAVGDLALSAIPLVGPAARGVMSASKALAPTAAKFAEDYMLRTGMQLYAKPVDLSRRGFFGLPKASTSTENALVPTNTSITSAPIASELTSISPLEYLIQKIANAPTLRRDFLEQVAKTTASQALKGTLPNVVQRTLKDIGVHEVAKADLAALEGYSRVRNHIDDAVEEGSFFPANWSSDEIIREVIKDPELFGIANASPSLLNKIAGLIETHGFENAAITTALPKMNTRLVEPELRPGTVFVTPDATKDVLAAMWERELKQNALVPTNTSITSAPIASELTSISPLDYLTQKIADTPMSRRDFLEQVAKTAASQALKGTQRLTNLPIVKPQTAVKPQTVIDLPQKLVTAPKILSIGNIAKAYGFKKQRSGVDRGSYTHPETGETISVLRKQEFGHSRKDGSTISSFEPKDFLEEHLENRGYTKDTGYTKPEQQRRGGPINLDAMHMAVWNKQLRKQHG